MHYHSELKRDLCQLGWFFEQGFAQDTMLLRLQVQEGLDKNVLAEAGAILNARKLSSPSEATAPINSVGSTELPNPA